MTAEALLSLLDKVKRTGQGKWQASCPAHEDRSPSLAIKEAEDGTVLIKRYVVSLMMALLCLLLLGCYSVASPSQIQISIDFRNPLPGFKRHGPMYWE